MKVLGLKVDQKQETQIHTKPLLNSKHVTQPWNLALQTDLGVEDFQVTQLTLNREEKLSNLSIKVRMPSLNNQYSNWDLRGLGLAFFSVILKKRRRGALY